VNVTQFVVSTLLIAVSPGVTQIMLLNQTVLNGRRGGLNALGGSVVAFAAWSLAAAGGLTAILGANPGAMTAVKWGGGLFLVFLGIRSILALRHPAAAPVDPAAEGAHEALGPDGTEPIPDYIEDIPELAFAGSTAATVGGTASDGPTTGSLPVVGGGRGESLPDDAPAGRSTGDFRIGVVTNLANPQGGVFMLAFLPQFVPAGGDAMTWMAGLGLVWTAIVSVVLLALVLLVDQARVLLSSERAQMFVGGAAGLVLVVLGFGTILS